MSKYVKVKDNEAILVDNDKVIGYVNNLDNELGECEIENFDDLTLEEKVTFIEGVLKDYKALNSKEDMSEYYDFLKTIDINKFA